jgi:hypothetical protein
MLTSINTQTDNTRKKGCKVPEINMGKQKEDGWGKGWKGKEKGVEIQRT